MAEQLVTELADQLREIGRGPRPRRDARRSMDDATWIDEVLGGG